MPEIQQLLDQGITYTYTYDVPSMVYLGLAAFLIVLVIVLLNAWAKQIFQ